MQKPTYLRAVEFTQNKILELRTKNDMSQRALAEIAGVHPTTLGKIETKVSSPTADTIYRIALALGIDPGELIWSGRLDQLPPE